ncbi:DNA helicase-2 / ATP-dependent DNA helicase PcrA [Caloranaerobacter azorensis DSM 13643]|uniref:DNA 3'-5' helicase n=1 Tax=Caloranaerobacter azorensis DSM 13643 TaxID=1121264 RepID=A0A1M5WLN2_9FIRM|nr:ATP-dependent helicase [Caloranaerobacter azorensis]SHH88465.1 DNA helicase-2 / ATP-dependent DNA helicase PcrA [Caloranaerobacter azorensis DSM 13643]
MQDRFFQLLNEKFGICLTNQQREAVLHKEGPAIVLAVPGAGKTTVLICRTLNLILNHRINPNNILTITFSKATASDMKNRFISTFGNILNIKPNFSTIHSFSYSVIRYFSKIKGIKYELLEGNDSKINKNLLLKEIYYKFNKIQINDEKLEDLINIISYIKNMMIKPEDINDFNNFGIKNLYNIFIEYENYKKRAGFIDFDDMLTLSLNILENNPIILMQCRKRYPYIQVDEGQDTSKVQNKLIKLLAYPKNNLFVVADDDQSIYGFRGATPHELLNFKDIDYPDAKIFFMEENFRSTKTIVDISNKFIQLNKIRFKKNLYTKNEEKEPIKIIKLNDELEQVEYIINQLKKIKDLSNTAVLFRNNISSIGLIDKLERNNIPFYIKDTKKLYIFKHWVCQDIISFLKLSLDNTDMDSFQRIYYKMNGYISKKSVEYIKSTKPKENIFESLINLPELKNFQKRNYIRLKSDFKYLSKLKAYDAISFIENELEYRGFLIDNSRKYGNSFEYSNTIISILKIIAKETNSINEFLARLDSLSKMLENARFNKNNAVTLSTIHSAKGLEFESVYIIDLIDGEFPSSSSIEALESNIIEPLEEERRIFYVGITRTKRNLNLITINFKNGERVLPSRFVQEIEAIEKPLRYDYKVGSTVEHKKFGKGVIKFIDDKNIVIDFEKVGIKQLSTRICVEKNLLNRVGGR